MGKIARTVIVCMFAFASCASAALNLYSDSVSTDPPSPDQIDGTGWWDGGDPEGTYEATVLSWVITNNVTSVHYKYTFTHPEHDMSYFIVEVSDNFTLSDITSGLTHEINTYSDTGSNNQGMPGSVFGIKFDSFTSYTDNGDGTITETIEFDCTRLPTWGDFYARCGIHPDDEGGHGAWDAAWNVGFVSSDSNDGNDSFHIAVPDSVVPEPSSMAIIGIGLMALLRRRKQF